MLKQLMVIVVIILSVGANAQTKDSIYVIRKGNNWSLRYTVKPGENMHMLAMRYYVSEPILEYENEPDNIRKLVPGQTINIPVTADNYYVTKQSLLDNNIRDLYYQVLSHDDIGMISTYAGVTKAQMRTWNNLKGNTITPGQVLLVGWLRVMAKDTGNLATLAAFPSTKKLTAADTARMRIPGGLDTVYERQTNNGMNVLTEKGTAVFFEKPGKNNVYYAFHNSTPRGTIIKVSNPGTGKTIYVKVLGPVPDTKFYANSIIGICNTAKEALGVTDNKAWCELSYSPN